MSSTLGRMIVTLQTERLRTIEQLEGFVAASKPPGELNRSLRQGRLVPESSDTRHQPPGLWPNPRFMLTFSLDDARVGLWGARPSVFEPFPEP